MKSTMINISIIIPVFNRWDLLKKCLTSIKQQSGNGWECIIVDDGSDKVTLNQVRDFIEDDTRFRLFQRPLNRSKGANACRNYGLEQAVGDYVHWFDSDDTYKDGSLKDLVERLDDSKSEMIFINWEYHNSISNKSALISYTTDFDEQFWFDFISKKTLWTTASCIWRREYLKGKDVFDERMSCDQDYECYMRLVPKVKRAETIDIDCFNYSCQQEGSITSKVNWTSRDLLSKFLSLRTFSKMERMVRPNNFEVYYQIIIRRYIFLLRNLFEIRQLTLAVKTIITFHFLPKTSLFQQVYSCVTILIFGGIYMTSNRGRGRIKYN
jgi:glycosyltransferase involved in cell wall biosynthesis